MKSYKRLCQETQYEIFDDMANSVAQATLAMILYNLHLKGWGKKRLNAVVDDFMTLNTMADNLMGGTMKTGTDDCMKFLTEEYGIDFDKIKVKKQSKRDFMKSKE